MRQCQSSEACVGLWNKRSRESNMKITRFVVGAAQPPCSDVPTLATRSPFAVCRTPQLPKFQNLKLTNERMHFSVFHALPFRICFCDRFNLSALRACSILTCWPALSVRLHPPFALRFFLLCKVLHPARTGCCFCSSFVVQGSLRMLFRLTRYTSQNPALLFCACM